MDKDQLKIFKSAFKRANHGKIAMPNKIDINKIYDIEFYTNRMRDGYSVRFFITKDHNQKYSLELLGRNDFSSWHKLIESNGNIIELDNFKGQFERTINSDDNEKTEKERNEIQEYNDSLNKQLLNKGLVRNFDNEEFEENNVIKIRNYGF